MYYELIDWHRPSLRMNKIAFSSLLRGGVRGCIHPIFTTLLSVLSSSTTYLLENSL